MSDRTISDIGVVIFAAPFAAALLWGWLWTARHARGWKSLGLNDQLITVCTVLWTWLIAPSSSSRGEVPDDRPADTP